MLFEIIMLMCFGCAWPISIYKSYKSKTAKGKSGLFLFIVFIGYIAGIFYKIFYNYDFVIYFYILNSVMVAIDLTVYIKNVRNDKDVGSSTS